MTRIQAGQRLQPGEEVEMCREMREANEMWLATNMRLRYAEDFQAVEDYRIIEAILRKEGLTMEMVEALMRWQPERMAAMVQQRPLPPLPAALSPAVVRRLTQKLPFVMSSTSPAPGLTAPPFTEGFAAFDSPVIRGELEALMRDHAGLIDLGKGYRGFDPLGKEAFLDQLALVEDRWKVLITRFKLMGDLNPAFLAESVAYLQRVGMTVDDFHAVVDEAHELMRADAVREGLQR